MMSKGPPHISVKPAVGDTLREPAALPDTVPAAVPDGRVLCGDVNIRVDREGVWYYDDREIHRSELVCLFASVLVRDAEGAYWLVTPAEICGVDVEDAPFLAVEMFVAGERDDQIVSFRTNVDEIVSLDQEHPLSVTADAATGEPSPYVRIRDGLDARLSRAVYYDLVDHSEPRYKDGRIVFGVWSSGSFFEVGSIESDEDYGPDLTASD